MVIYSDVLVGTITANAVFDTNTGDWIEGIPTEFTIPCRAESSSGEGYITDKDGQRIDYSWIVYMPKLSPALQVGTKVTVLSGGKIILKDTVKRFSVDWFNCRAWL